MNYTVKKYDKEKPVISIHIPKCGGSSVRRVLKKWYKRKLYLHYFNEPKRKMPKKYNLKSLFGRNYKRGICIHGHYNKVTGFGI